MTSPSYFIVTKSEVDDPTFKDWRESRLSNTKCDVIPTPMTASFFKAMDYIITAALNHDSSIRDVTVELPKTWLAPMASWRHMFVSQPPVKATFYVCSGNNHKGWECQLAKTKLTRLGDIVDWVNGEYAVKARESEHKWVRLKCDWDGSEVDKLDELDIGRLL